MTALSIVLLGAGLIVFFLIGLYIVASVILRDIAGML